MSVNLKKSLEVANRVIELMGDNQSPAKPRNYEIWYNYLTSKDDELKKSVDRAVSDDGILTETAAAEIYQNYLCPSNGVKEVGAVNSQIGGEIDQVMQMLDAALGTSQEFGESLNEKTGQLETETDPETIKMIVESLVHSTKAIEENNQELQAKLHVSANQIKDLNTSLDEVRTESLTDQLTGIPNRKCFDQEIERLVKEGYEEGKTFSLLVGDIDFFKKFNDTYGHQTGDQVLKLVAHSLKSNLKGKDIAARYGGEEFVVLLPDTSLKDAIVVGDLIRKSVMAKELVKKSTGERLGTITMSFGAAVYHKGEKSDDIVNRADICLYAAKNAGRNQVKCETDPDIDFTSEVA